MSKRDDVLKLHSEGKSLREIAKILGLKSHTSVQYYLKNRIPSERQKIKRLFARYKKLSSEITLVSSQLAQYQLNHPDLMRELQILQTS